MVDFNEEDRKISLSMKALQNYADDVYEDVADVDYEDYDDEAGTEE